MPAPEMSAQSESAAGAAVYSRFTLRIYDFAVLGLSNPLVWRCATSKLTAFYNRHLTGNHLDVGVGTGYYLDKCAFPVAEPRVGLFDLNANSLAVAARRIARYQPITFYGDVLRPLDIEAEPFESISLFYLLHCLPGALRDKASVFQNLKPLLVDGGTIYGATILGVGKPFNVLGRRLMHIYNKRGIFSNYSDDLESLRDALEDNFSDVTTQQVGHVALFSGRK